MQEQALNVVGEFSTLTHVISHDYISDLFQHTTQAKSIILAALVASAAAFSPFRPVCRTTALSMADSVEERVRTLVKTQLNPEAAFADSASFMEDLGADSLDAVELIMSLEEEFDIEIPDDQVEGITTVQAAIDFVKASSK